MGGETQQRQPTIKVSGTDGVPSSPLLDGTMRQRFQTYYSINRIFTKSDIIQFCQLFFSKPGHYPTVQVSDILLEADLQSSTQSSLTFFITVVSVLLALKGTVRDVVQPEGSYQIDILYEAIHFLITRHPTWEMQWPACLTYRLFYSPSTDLIIGLLGSLTMRYLPSFWAITRSSTHLGEEVRIKGRLRRGRHSRSGNVRTCWV